MSEQLVELVGVLVVDPVESASELIGCKPFGSLEYPAVELNSNSWILEKQNDNKRTLCISIAHKSTHWAASILASRRARKTCTSLP